MTLGASVTGKTTSTTQSTKWAATVHGNRNFRAYCCNIDSASIMGVAKEPVVVFLLSPNPICAGEDVDWDLSSSYAPGSTLTAWEIDWGDGGGTTSGSDFPNDTTSGTHTYTDPGTYTIEIDLTEGGGKTTTATYTLEVEYCGQVFNTGAYAYASFDGAGVYYIDWTDVSPAWVARNTGLSGDSLQVRSIVINPKTKGLKSTQHELWIATKGGVYKSTNGGVGWGKITMGDPSNLEFGDTTAATESDLDWMHVVIDPNDNDTIYVLGGIGQGLP